MLFSICDAAVFYGFWNTNVCNFFFRLVQKLGIVLASEAGQKIRLIKFDVRDMICIAHICYFT